MKIVLQRVSSASVEVDSKIVGKIGKGVLILLGIGEDYTEDKLEYFVKKIPNIRLWASDKKGFDLSLKDIDGEILVVSQFTLHGVLNGNKPDFHNSMKADKAEEIYDRFVLKLKEQGLKVETGKFGAMMNVSLINDGPVTLVLER